MCAPVRFAVLGEGPDEHGHSARGPDLSPLSEDELRGCVVSLAARVLAENMKRKYEILSWTLVESSSRGRFGPPPAPYEILVDENLLPRFLEKLLCPVRRVPQTHVPADFVVLAADSELHERFQRAFQRLRSELQDRSVPVLFKPEMEVLLVQSKEALEAAVGRARCTSEAPGREGDLKESLRHWLHRYGCGRNLSARTRQDIAEHLDITENSYLNSVGAWRQLVEGISKVMGYK